MIKFLLIILNVFFVFFTDKPEKTTPQLSERAKEQRAKWNIPTDEMDYPVSPMYLQQVTEAGGKIFHCSRWFNGRVGRRSLGESESAHLRSRCRRDAR
jgi:hypothetical protein